MELPIVPLHRLTRCCPAESTNQVTEIYEDYHQLDGIRRRVRDLWNEHTQRFTVGMAVLLRNRWDDEMEVIITNDGWILTLKMKGEASRFVAGDRAHEQAVAFISPDCHWSAVDGNYLIAHDVAENMVILWLCMREVPRRWGTLHT